jgi:putative transposase
LGEHGLLRPLTKRVVERALEAEVTARLGYAPPARHGRSPGHCRHGQGKNTVQTETAPVAIDVPRDRDRSVEPQLVKQRQRRLEGVDATVLALSARGLSRRESQDHREAGYGVAVSPTLLSNVTDAGLDEVRPWQARPLAAVYPIQTLRYSSSNRARQARGSRKRSLWHWASP